MDVQLLYIFHTARQIKATDGMKLFNMGGKKLLVINSEYTNNDINCDRNTDCNRDCNRDCDSNANGNGDVDHNSAADC